MKKAITLILILTMAFALACSNNQKPVENTPSPTSTVSETPALPTESPTEVPTAEPTATPEPTPLPSTLTYEERLNLERLELRPSVWYYAPVERTLASSYEVHAEQGFIALCEILSVKFYIGWEYRSAEFVKGHTITEARVIEVRDEYNDAGIKPGDIVNLRTVSYIVPWPMWDAFPLFSKELNIPIESKEDYYELKKNVHEFAVEYPIERGRDYAYFIDYCDLPMKEGERYTLMGTGTESGEYYIADLVYPESYELDVVEFAKEHNFVYTNACLEMAKEIAALFRDPA